MRVKNQLVKLKNLISKRHKWPSTKVRRKKMKEKLMELLLTNRKREVSQSQLLLIKRERRVKSKKRSFSNRLRHHLKGKSSLQMSI